MPFLEEHVASGRGATIIHEYNVVRHLDNEYVNQNLEDDLSQNERSANLLLDESVNKGKRFDGIDYTWFDWGFLDAILKLNGSSPGAIRSMIEPLRASTVRLLWEEILLEHRMPSIYPTKEAIEVEKRIIEAKVKVCYERDMRVLSLAKQLRAENPGRAIAIPRGYAHLGMAPFFDHAEFDITLAARHSGSPRFTSEAIIALFNNKLSDEEMGRLALLSLLHSSYMDEKWNEVMRGAGSVDSKLNELTVVARRLALESAEKQRNMYI